MKGLFKKLIGKKRIKRKGRAKKYLKELKKKLVKTFQKKNIKSGEGLEFPSEFYGPQVDISVGPFATKRSLRKKYDQLLKKHNLFIKEITKKAINKKHLNFHINSNPRCFVAIEVEDTTQGNKKHVLGSITNTHILGKVGIVVTYSKRTLNMIHKYLKFAKEVGKTKEYLFRNVALISKKDFDEVINKFL